MIAVCNTSNTDRQCQGIKAVKPAAATAGRRCSPPQTRQPTKAMHHTATQKFQPHTKVSTQLSQSEIIQQAVGVQLKKHKQLFMQTVPS
jgi:hypothetical protein